MYVSLLSTFSYTILLANNEVDVVLAGEVADTAVRDCCRLVRRDYIGTRARFFHPFSEKGKNKIL